MSSADADDAPRSMRDKTVQHRRRAMLGLPHVAPLTAFVAKLRERGNVEVPEFDPFDGGVEARALFLFEKPGPKGAVGSGFISRNNDSDTADATFRFMQDAGIPRTLTVTWNVVPWWNGTPKIRAAELRDGVESVKDLVALLPVLQAIVLVGNNAAKARPYLITTGLPLFQSAHPSPLVRASWPDRWNAIPKEWAKIKAVIGLQSDISYMDEVL